MTRSLTEFKSFSNVSTSFDASPGSAKRKSRGLSSQSFKIFTWDGA